MNRPQSHWGVPNLLLVPCNPGCLVRIHSGYTERPANRELFDVIIVVDHVQPDRSQHFGTLQLQHVQNTSSEFLLIICVFGLPDVIGTIQYIVASIAVRSFNKEGEIDNIPEVLEQIYDSGPSALVEEPLKNVGLGPSGDEGE